MSQIAHSVSFDDNVEKDEATGKYKPTGGAVYRPQELEMPTIGIKRSESMEVLNLTLHQCARDGNVDDMRRMIQSLTGNVKKKINQHDDEDLTPLHYAARYNHYPIVRMLVEAGADVNSKDEDGATPLHYAARYKRIRIKMTPTTEGVAGKLERQKDEEFPLIHLQSDDEGVTFVPVENGESEVRPAVLETPEVTTPVDFDAPTVENSVILYMVSKGARINANDMYGSTPLQFAAMRGNEMAALELLSCRDIDISAVDRQNSTALHLAVVHEEVEVVRMLIEAGADVQCVDEDNGTPLHLGCMAGSLEICKLLFEAGEKKNGWITVSQMVTEQDHQQNTALHLAVENRNLEVTKLCLEKNADVNATRDGFNTALHLAASAGDVRIVQLLVEHNARVDIFNLNQQAPLHRAASFNHFEVAAYLLSKGAKINRRDKDNFTPLLLASCYGHVETIKLLLQHGAKIANVEKNDKTSIFLAAEEDQVEALQLLLEHVTRTKDQDLIDTSDRYDNTPLHVAAQNGYLECVQALLDNDATIDAKNEEEQTPLHLAAKAGKTSIVRELLKRDKTIINDEDEDTNTALHLASLAGNTKVVSALINCGADIEARNCTLWTPMDCAAARGQHKCIYVLLEADAPVDPVDRTKTTPLHLASARGHVQAVEVLLKNNASVSAVDANDNNCLDLAIDNGHKDVAMKIVSCERWQEALRNESMSLKTMHRNTPMRKLIRKMPDVAEKVFNRCTTSNNNNPDQPNYQITFNYEFLDDQYSSWRGGDSDAMSSTASVYDDDHHVKKDVQTYTSDSTVLKRNHPLFIMVTNNQEDLLAHPLVTSLLRHKWNSYGRYFYYLNLFIYIVFIAFLTGYMANTKPPFYYRNLNASHYDKLNISDECEKNAAIASAVTGGSISQPLFASIGKWVVIALTVFNIFRELLQLCYSKLNYLGFENLMEWTIYITSFIFVFDVSQCQQNTGARLSWQWQLGAVAMFLAWIELVLFIRKLPQFGIYVVMFTDILLTFIQFFPVFVLFVVAFGMSYFMLFQNKIPFQTVGDSLLKTAVMMIGEFEYESVFLSHQQGSPDYRDQNYYPELSFIIFVFFLILMSVLIMNLLVGLAVDDIKAVQEQAVLKRLAMQVELALDVESILPQLITRKFVVKSKSITPNIKSRNPIKRLMHLESTTLSSAAISKALNPDLDDLERLEENQEKMQTDLNNLKGRMKAMKSQNEKLESMLSALLKKHQVDWQEEDEAQEEAGN